jgi:hypothetical protein
MSHERAYNGALRKRMRPDIQVRKKENKKERGREGGREGGRETLGNVLEHEKRTGREKKEARVCVLGLAFQTFLLGPD